MIFFPSHWLLSYITIVETMDSGEGGMNPVTMTIINPQKENWPSWGSNQRPPVLSLQHYRLRYGARHMCSRVLWNPHTSLLIAQSVGHGRDILLKCLLDPKCKHDFDNHTPPPPPPPPPKLSLWVHYRSQFDSQSSSRSICSFFVCTITQYLMGQLQ